MLHTVSSTIKHEHHHEVTAIVKGDPWVRYLLLAIAVLLLLLFLSTHGWAQTSSAPGQNVYDRSNLAYRVNCVTGCSATSGFADNSGFTVGSTTINVIGGYYSTSTPSISVGNAGRARIDASSYLVVDCAVGCSGSSFADNSAFTAGTTAIGLVGGWYSTSPTNCTSGNACLAQLTVDRKLFVQDFQGTSPWVVSANGGSFAVTGTFWQSTQPVSSTQLPSALDGSGFLKIHEQGTAAISAASLPLPSGAATSAKQPALGTAGTPSSDVISIQGVSSMTAVKVDGSGVTQPISGTVTATQATGTNLHMVCDSGCSSSAGFADNSAFTVGTTAINILGGLYDTGADPTITNGSAARARVDSHSYLLVDGSQVTQPVSGTFWQGTQPISAASLPLPSGAAQDSTLTGGTLKAEPYDGTNVIGTAAHPVQVSLANTAANSTAVKVDGSAVTQPVSGTFWQATQPVSGTVTANLGTTGDPCGPGQAKSYAFYDASTNGATQLVALSSGKIVYVCSYAITSSSTTANTIKLVYGTGSNCATGQTAITPGVIVEAGTSTGPAGKVVPNSAGLQTIASNELCVLTNAAQAAQVEVSYVQQ